MHVGLNLVFLVPGETGGMEVYARELIVAMTRERPEIRLTAFINREAAEAGGGPWGELIPAVTVPVRARRRWEWVRGEQQLLPPLARRAGVDLLHSLASTAPAWGRYRRVVTVHDLIYRIHWRAHGVLAAGMHVLVPLAVRRSDRVIAVSSSTRDDLVSMLGVAPEKVDVIPQGVGHTARAAPLDEASVRSRFGIAERQMVLNVAAKRQHKNQLRLIEALALLPAATRPVLVLVGYATPYERTLRTAARDLGVDADTRFLGWVDGDELEGLYAAARCFAFPSLYEGFGFPVIEAMQRGVPVVCSGRGSLAEVAGDAALLFDPEDPAAIARSIARLLNDGDLSARLAESGRRQAQRFSWDDAARATVATYERTLAEP